MTKTPAILLKTRAAAERANEVVAQLGLREPPIDPLGVVASEHPILVVRGDDFRDRFDGQLEYHPDKRRFLLLFNTKYDRHKDRHHPRTRFSIAHELGHYFLEEHHAYLRGGGRSHGSRGEFASSVDVEREADAFAAGLLMPASMLNPRVNEDDLSIERIIALAEEFDTSLVSTAIQSTLSSDFPTAVVGVRNGQVAWHFQSPCLIDAGCYPGERGSLRSSRAIGAWEQFSTGVTDIAPGIGFVKDWFRTYDRDYLDHLSVREEYLPVHSMQTMVVLLTIPEDELYHEDDD